MNMETILTELQGNAPDGELYAIREGELVLVTARVEDDTYWVSEGVTYVHSSAFKGASAVRVALANTVKEIFCDKENDTVDSVLISTEDFSFVAVETSTLRRIDVVTGCKSLTLHFKHTHGRIEVRLPASLEKIVLDFDVLNEDGADFEFIVPKNSEIAEFLGSMRGIKLMFE